MSASQNLTDQIIKQVRNRPTLWDRREETYANVQAMDMEWMKIENVMKRDKDFIKKRWRAARDTFRNELKKVKKPENGTQPLITYYSGSWPHFESMLFLKDSLSIRTRPPYVPEEVECRRPYMSEENEENRAKRPCLEDNEESNSRTQLEHLEAEQDIQEIDETFDEDRKPFVLSPNAVNMHIESVWTEKEPAGEMRKEDWTDLDEDVHFAKSLVGYLRRLNPLKKLMVRNEIQNIFLRELMCDTCKCKGLKKLCQCA